MKHKVYTLIDCDDKVVYIGHTSNTKQRYYQHTSRKPNGSSCGKFYGRTDLQMKVVKEFKSRKEAFWYQCELQSQYGFVTDAMKYVEAGKIGGPASSPTKKVINNLKRMMKTKYTCEKCGREIGGASNYSIHIKRNLCKI